MNRYSDDNPASELDEESADYGKSDGLEIALPDNAETYRLLTGEDPEENPKVEVFREAYDEAMAGGDGDHEKCMEAGRKALEGMENGSARGRVKGMGMGMMGGGENPLNRTMG